MKILIISNMFPSKNYPNYGIFVKNFVDSLRESNIDLKISVISGKTNNNILKIYQYFCFTLKTLIKLKINEYDLIYIHFANHSLIPILLYPFKQKIYKKLIVNPHGTDLFPQSNMGKILFKYTSKIIKRSHYIVVPSSYYKNICNTNLNIHSKKIIISPSAGINLQVFRDKHVIKKGFNIGFVGWLNSEKGVETFLDSINIVHNAIQKNLFIHIVGNGPLKNKVLSIGNKYSSVKNIKIIYYGLVDQNKLSEIYNRLDLFVFPSIKESLGLVGLEAMACGVPVIGSNIEAIQTYLIDHKNGLIFKKKSSIDLANKIIKYYSFPKETKQNFINFAKSTAKNYDQNIIMNKLIMLLYRINKEN